MLLRLEGVSRSFGGRVLFREVSLAVGPGERLGLIGANGVGKSTLLRIMGGSEPCDEGRVLTPREVRVGRLRQEIDPGREESVFAAASAAFADLDALERELRLLEAEMERLGREGQELPAAVSERYDRCRTRFEAAGGFEREARVERVLEGLGFDTAARARPLRTFSGGWLMRVELAKLLLARPDVLLLDEPGNHLDLPSIQWFEETLAAYPGAVVVVSHDRTFLRRHATRIAELEGGRLVAYAGGYDAYLEQKRQRRELLEARKRTQDRRIAETRRFVDRFRYKASKARQVQSRLTALEKLERIEVEPESRRRMRLRIPPPRRAGADVLRLAGIHKRYGEVEVYRGVDLLVRRGDRVALVGPNGAGKSTLLRIAAGVLAFDAGERQVGHNVDVAFFGQHQREALDPSRSALEELESAAHTEDVPRLRGHLGAFLFSGDDVKKKVSVLSGGEKARLALAKLLLRPVNFLVLDEPTNHLDLAAREVLEAALREYAGTLLFISHDRTFIETIATRVVEVRGGVLEERLHVSGGPAPAAVAPAEATHARDAESAPPSTKRARAAARESAREQARREARARKRLAAVEERILELEERVSEIDHELADPAVYRDGDATRALREEQEALRQEIQGAYAEWERLAPELEASHAEREPL